MISLLVFQVLSTRIKDLILTQDEAIPFKSLKASTVLVVRRFLIILLP
ncbi:MAG: hypothetical protein ICV54_04255 [Nostoc sp. C3-bin3]|nr:hypothetical protein [Nostoc sp. C3-bin3]